MYDRLLKYLTYKLPAWVCVLGVLVISAGLYYTQAKPPKTMIPMQLAGVDKMLVKVEVINATAIGKDPNWVEFVKYLNRYLYLNVLEYKNFYRISYGTLTDEENQLFDDELKKLGE